MGEKKRWSDPANDGQVDYVKVGVRMFALILLLTLAAVVKIGIRDNWFTSFKDLF
jgi:hypothetical protein